ncbi:unnamed protein product [Soboliphyme baturini]|uniref:Ovule protein n=1 Tax=Soboliphyme baturini TaxID=241478 RepID=A0A183ITP5_9BILA|nr:unnamed protein product [Soboliphyme baturini]
MLSASVMKMMQRAESLRMSTDQKPVTKKERRGKYKRSMSELLKPGANPKQSSGDNLLSSHTLSNVSIEENELESDMAHCSIDDSAKRIEVKAAGGDSGAASFFVEKKIYFSVSFGKLAFRALYFGNS